MRIVIMQPYFFPYLGYFQLLAASDAFIVYDNAQYIKGGWINRNRILMNGKPGWITMPVEAGSASLSIRDRKYSFEDRIAKNMLRRIAYAYRSAPNFDRIVKLVDDVLSYPDPNVAFFNVNLLRKVASYLDITTPIFLSSDLSLDTSITGAQARVIDICKKVDTTTYINPIGGKKLYSGEDFAKVGMDLRFLSCRASAYEQFGNEFVGDLSIIDVMMFNGIQSIKIMLEEYDLVN